MDDLSSRKSDAARDLMEAAGAALRFHPLHSPDFLPVLRPLVAENRPQGAFPGAPHPIGIAFSKLKALLRKAAERIVEGLWDAIGRLVDLITPAESATVFTAAGHEPE